MGGIPYSVTAVVGGDTIDKNVQPRSLCKVAEIGQTCKGKQ